MSWLVIAGILSVFGAVQPRASAGTIIVTSPTASSVWEKGGTYDITWTSVLSGPDVKIEYDYWFYSTPTTIASRTANDGSYSWTIPTGMSSRDDYFIRIWDADDALTYADSAEFEITSQSTAAITVTSPSVLDIWYTGNTYTVRWTNTGTIANVKITYDCLICSTDGTIVDSTANTGSFAWAIPTSLGTDQYYTVRVADASNPGTNEDSIPFVIRPGTNWMLIIGAVAGIAIILIVVAVVAVMMSKRKKAAMGPQQASIPVTQPQMGWQQPPPATWQPAPAPQPQAYVPQQQTGLPAKFCRSCGRSIPAESVFCTFCGGRN